MGADGCGVRLLAVRLDADGRPVAPRQGGSHLCPCAEAPLARSAAVATLPPGRRLQTFECTRNCTVGAVELLHPMEDGSSASVQRPRLPEARRLRPSAGSLSGGGRTNAARG